ncbi:unknown [Sutterella wadsworthensis CAG:135]|nr:unknown [Sutterella wadsworthensis CAG:135]
MSAVNLWRPCRISPKQRAARFMCKRHQTAGEISQPSVVSTRQADGQEKGSRNGSRCCQIRKIHSERLIAHIFRIGIGKEMRA